MALEAAAAAALEASRQGASDDRLSAPDEALRIETAVLLPKALAVRVALEPYAADLPAD